MDEVTYSPPVKAFLTYGSVEGQSDWLDYFELGLSHEHIPELMTMVADDSLHQGEPSSAEVWAPLHAWRALGQLRAVEAIPVLLDLLYRIEECDDDWLGEEFPDVFALIGAAAIPGLTEYLADSDHLLFARAAAAHALTNIGNMYPEEREVCADILEHELTRYRSNDPLLNGFLVADLLDLKALKALPIIEKAFRHSCVDLSIMGDYEDVEIELGLKTERTTPPPDMQWVKNQSSTGPVSVRESFVRNEEKIGRNDPCPCGSGKKYKKCCMNK